METQLNPRLVKAGTIPQPIIIIGAIILACLVYTLAAGSGSGREMESDRLIVAECWRSIERKADSPGARREMADVCTRMERGFHLKHGATP